MAKLLRAALTSDPFTAQTVRALTTLAKITAVGGIAVWAMSNLATWVLSATVLDGASTPQQREKQQRWRGSPLRSSSPRSVNSSPAELAIDENSTRSSSD